MDLNKAFNITDREVLIAKLNAYGFKGQNQKAKINITFNSWTELIQGVPQASVIGPLLYKIYIIDLF